MSQRIRAHLPLALLAAALPALSGCGASIYRPRPSPRIQVTSEGSSLVLVKDGRTYGTGIFGNGIEEAVKGNARAEDEAHSYQTNGTAGFVLGLVGSLTSAGGAALLVGNEVQATPSSSLTVGALVMALGGLTVSIIGNVLTNSAQPHLWNAVNIYNDGLPQYPMAPGYGYPGAPYPVAPGYAPPAGVAPQQYPPGYTPPGYAPPGYAPRPMAPPMAPAPPPVPPPVLAPQPAPVPQPPPAVPAPPG